MLKDPIITSRKNHLVQQTRITLKTIRSLFNDKDGDAFTDPKNLAEAVNQGILDAPHLKNNSFARGIIQTRILNGACEVVDDQGNNLSEEKRLAAFL